MRSLIMLILLILSNISQTPAIRHSTYGRLYLASCHSRVFPAFLPRMIHLRRDFLISGTTLSAQIR